MKIVGVSAFSDFLMPKIYGEPVNVHVVSATPEPTIDFAAMQKVIETQPLDILGGNGTKRTIPEGGEPADSVPALLGGTKR